MDAGLIIVESPTKIKTLKKILGKSYRFASSMGHIRDLPAKSLGIDLEDDFSPQFLILEEKKATVKSLQQEAKSASVVYLCPDPDREGEAIAWHLREILPKQVKTLRVTFRSITAQEVQEAMQSPREIDLHLVHAQHARRILDRLVGYMISPFLFRRLQRGRVSEHSGALSAGRVQSVALKFVVDREKEIETFVPEEYWQVKGLFSDQEGKSFWADLHTFSGVRILRSPSEKVKGGRLLRKEKEAQDVLDQLKEETFILSSIEKKERLRHPVPPFITSSLQQEASRYFSFSSARTMSVAQSLYEGVEVGTHGFEGLITYMRTDSVRAAPESIAAVRRYVLERFGKEFIPSTPRAYSSKKSAQDSHECIRPTRIDWSPDFLRPYLSLEQFKLYELIWKRFVASQMSSALYEVLQIEIVSSCSSFRAVGSRCIFLGFLTLYEEKKDDEEHEKEVTLPKLQVGQSLSGQFQQDPFATKPKPRFTEASLIKELEKSGLGRPSTYAAIMNKIQSKAYTHKEKGRLKPTDLGRVVVNVLEVNFPMIMDAAFTVRMEDALEEISECKKEWKSLLREFWSGFHPVLQKAEKEFIIPKSSLNRSCPECKDGELQKIWSKNRFFIGCSRYPDCNYTSALGLVDLDRSRFDPNFDWNQTCPLCSQAMILREGRFGLFLGCSDFPNCRGSVRIEEKIEGAENMDSVACPACGCSGQLVQKRSRFGSSFYGCNLYPQCDVIGKSMELILSKFADRPQTAVVQKEKTSRKGKKTSSKKTKQKSTRTSKATKKEPLALEPRLAALLGPEPIFSSQELLKSFWGYVRSKNLQDPSDRRVILPGRDAELVVLLGDAPLPMTRVLSALQSLILRKK
ncbi:type I DNA topoisomerase [Candidatus Similichlamydia laticola]|uniref:DNA topoisomerase 1 n=1 Tax=Candidatus Similichlamydia laticola TaxID=2170265 RepID=A0A369KCT5_9BACT|nr:type I DNA topoisomerase [Candidatus Similichlamydia laticola]RDB31270.1 DNA topoisomerase I [Candidatus Similichlamydia laticola]